MAIAMNRDRLFYLTATKKIMTATIIPTPNRVNNQVIGQFYPLQREELIALRRNRLINNVAFVHLALRYENPYCDRPIEIIPKEFAERWLMPESSIYEALGKLKRLGVLALKTGRVLLQWLNPGATTEEVQNIEESLENQIAAKVSEPILRSQNLEQEPIPKNEIPGKPEPKPLSQKESEPSKTIQTTQTHQKRDEVVDQLEEAGIPFDDDVAEAVRSHHVSQVMRAIAIIKEKDDISYPKGYFHEVLQLASLKLEFPTTTQLKDGLIRLRSFPFHSPSPLLSHLSFGLTQRP